MARVSFLLLFFITVFLFLIARLFYWQIIKSPQLRDMVSLQHQTGKVVKSERGKILSDDGRFLALNKEAYNIFANPQETFVTKKLSEILDESEDRLGSLLSNKSLKWVKLKTKAEKNVVNTLSELNLSGIGWEEDDLRYYPESSVSAHLLGFLGKKDDGTDKGYFGLEGYYDDILRGKEGYSSYQIDVTGKRTGWEKLKDLGVVYGVDIQTSINLGIQIMAEEKLIAGIEKYGAKSGSLVIVDPKTGAIMALAASPGFDGNKYWDFNDELFRNPLISDSFEPGSIFKIIVMSSALDAKVIEPETVCDICTEPYKIDKYTISTWNNKYHPNSTMTNVIVNSDNIGMVFVGNKLGKDKLWNYLSNFGFGKITGVDLQGEVTPTLKGKKDWSVVDLTTASFGQGIAVTPIQIVKAATAIANQGIMVSPHVVGKIQTDGWSKKVTLQKGERVISKEASERMTKMMLEAAKSGEAKWTYLEGFRVAGKTGTAQIPIKGHYDEEKTIASFIGFAPAENPKFLMLVTLREPTSSPWASETAAPLWYNIAKDLFLHFGIRPEN